MSYAWDESGIDDDGSRTFDHTAEAISAEEAAAQATKEKSQQDRAASTNALQASNLVMASGGFFGRQRQVQHLREIHRQRIEQLKNEKPADSSSDEEDRGDDNDARRRKTSIVLEDRRDIRKKESPPKKIVHFSPTPAVMRRHREPSSATNNNSAATPPAVASSDVAKSASSRLAPQVASRFRGANNDYAYPAKIGQKKEVVHSSTNLQRHRQLQQLQQRRNNMGGLFAGSGGGGGGGGGGGSGASTPPLGSGALSSSATPSAAVSGTATPSSMAGAAADAPTMLDIGSDKLPLRFFPDGRTVSNWRGVVRPSNAKNLKRRWSHSDDSDTRKEDPSSSSQQQQRSSSSSQLYYTPPEHVPHQGRKTPILNLQEVRESSPLKHTHVTVFNTFTMPRAVPTAHKHRNFNPVQEHISRALPAPRGEDDVAILKKPSDTTENDGRHSYNNVLADVRRVVLDDVRHNRHRIVQRQQELSPQRLPKPRELTNFPGGAASAAKKAKLLKKMKKKNADDDQQEEDDEDAEEAAGNNDKHDYDGQAAPRSSQKNQQQQQQQEEDTKKNDGRRRRTQLLLANAASLTDSGDDSDDFTHADDEKVVVGGDVIGGQPLLLPKARGRWDAMNEEIKKRYFSPPPPPVEPIGHALRVIPLAELCSMYRCSIKEFKGAIEMDQRIFGSLVRMMMMALPGNIKLTEDDVTKYYNIFDMNGNGGISFIEFLTTVVDFQTDRKETQFLHACFNNLLIASGQSEAVASEDLSAHAPWELLENEDVLFDCILKGLGRSARFPRVVEKTFAIGLAKSFKGAHREAQSALCQESFDGLFWEQFRLLVCLDPELIAPLRHMKL